MKNRCLQFDFGLTMFCSFVLRAFAIWGPIYLGELSFVVGQLVLSESSSIAPLIKEITAPFVMANLMQVRKSSC